MNRATPLLIVALALLAGEAAAQTKVQVADVVAAPMRRTLQLPGTVVAPQASLLTMRVAGSVEALLVEAGDRVEAGQPLVRLDDTLAKLEQERLRHGVEEADLTFRDAQRLAREAEALMGSQTVPPSKYRTQVAQAAIGEAKVRQLRASAAAQRTELERHTLTAPFAGAVTQRLVERGQWVAADTAVLRLVPMDPLRVDVEVPERYYGTIAPGAAVTVVPNTEGGRALPAAVGRIVPSGDTVSRTFRLHIPVANPGWALMPGLSVQAHIALDGGALDGGAGESVLQVPEDAVEHRIDGTVRVWAIRTVPDKGTVAQPETVRLGRRSGTLVEITAPSLRAGDRVIVRGAEGLDPGEPVTPEASTPAG